MKIWPELIAKAITHKRPHAVTAITEWHRQRTRPPRGRGFLTVEDFVAGSEHSEKHARRILKWGDGKLWNVANGRVYFYGAQRIAKGMGIQHKVWYQYTNDEYMQTLQDAKVVAFTWWLEKRNGEPTALVYAASALNVSKRTIQNWVSRGMELGLISKEHQFSKYGIFKTDTVQDRHYWYACNICGYKHSESRAVLQHVVDRHSDIPYANVLNIIVFETQDPNVYSADLTVVTEPYQATDQNWTPVPVKNEPSCKIYTWVPPHVSRKVASTFETGTILEDPEGDAYYKALYADNKGYRKGAGSVPKGLDTVCIPEGSYGNEYYKSLYSGEIKDNYQPSTVVEGSDVVPPASAGYTEIVDYSNYTPPEDPDWDEYSQSIDNAFGYYS